MYRKSNNIVIFNVREEPINSDSIVIILIKTIFKSLCLNSFIVHAARLDKTFTKS